MTPNVLDLLNLGSNPAQAAQFGANTIHPVAGPSLQSLLPFLGQIMGRNQQPNFPTFPLVYRPQAGFNAGIALRNPGYADFMTQGAMLH